MNDAKQEPDTGPAARVARRGLLAAGAAGAATVVGRRADAAPGARLGRHLAGKVALVTGAARGAGAAICAELAGQGADVVMVDAPGPIASAPYPLATLGELRQAAATVARRHRVQALPVAADVRDADQVEQAFAAAVHRFGGVDVVVANAGVNSYGSLEELTPAAIHDVMDVNVVGVAHTLRAAAPRLRAREGGLVVAIGSAEARAGGAGAAHYIASKWAVIGLIKSFALEMAGENVRAVVVNPTVFRSAMVLNEAAYAWAGVGSESELDNLFRQIHTLDVGILEPEDVAAAVGALAGPGGRYVSGTAVDVTAGLSSGWTA